jgi:hypothetical protein
MRATVMFGAAHLVGSIGDEPADGSRFRTVELSLITEHFA